MTYDFVHFAEQFGLMIREPIPDDRVHRVKTTDHKTKRNGAYIYNGVTGSVRNWATMQDWALFRPERQQEAPRIDRTRLRRLKEAAAREEREAHAAAARHAGAMLAIAKLLRPRAATKWTDGVISHPYLVRKGFPQAEGLVLPSDYHIPRKDRPDMVIAVGSLLVPMRDIETDRLIGMQTITDDGTKLFIPGSRAKGAVFRLGRAAELWLCEGLATAYSLQMALKALYREAEVLVCFSSGNVVEVARHLLGREVYVVADHDRPNPQAPQGAGRAAAEKTGFPWVQPDDEGTDVNDLHQAKGIKAVRDLLKRIL